MKPARTIIVSLATIVLAVGLAVAQNHEDDVAQSSAQARESMEAMGNFVKDVTFDENDIQNMLAYWEEINSLGDEGGSEVVYEGEEEEETIAFEELLADPEYRSWAKSKSLDPDIWLKKFMRIQVMMMKDSMAAGSFEGRAQMEALLAEIESQREQIGEVEYQQMKQDIEAGAAMLDDVGSAYKNLPEPTASEKALIDRYREQIMNLQ
jgi:Asp-tRNA(Asn)/Glu-tRNA(Gln) amidotransferase A subunit family amidase